MSDKHMATAIVTSRRSLNLLYGGVSLLIMTVVLAAFLMLAKLRQEAEAHAINYSQNIATSLNLTLKGIVDSINVALALSAEEISAYVSGPVPDRKAIEEVLRRAKRQHELSRVAFVRATNEKGDLVYGPGIPKPYISLASREYFKQLKNESSTELFISQPIMSRVNGKWIWLFARRINKIDGTFGGVVYSYFFVEDIGSIFSQIKIGEGSSIELRDANLRMIARYISPGTLQFPEKEDRSQDLDGDALESIARTGSYSSDSQQLDGIARLHAFHRNDLYGFIVNVGVARNVVLAKWQREAWGITALVAAFIALSIAFAVMIRVAWLRQQQAVASLEASREALEEAQKISSVGHYSFDLQSGTWECSGALDEIFGIGEDYPRDVAHWEALIAPGSRQGVREYFSAIVKQRLPFDYEYRINRANDGQERWVHTAGELNFDQDGRVIGLFGTIQDVSKAKDHEAELQHIANYDVLTDIPNRRLLADRLNQAVARAERSGNLMAVCCVDLDNFKPINDRHGHAAGDQVLVKVTSRLKRELRAEDTVARLGGDEFVLIFSGLANYEEIHGVLERVLNTVSAPIAVGEVAVTLSASIGVTLFPLDNADADTLLRHADQAMYRAKESGKNRYHLFDPEYDRRVQAHRQYQLQIKSGLQSGEFFLVYQPKVDLVSGEVVGVEALIRWQHPEHGLLMPGDFLSYVTEDELDVAVGEWVVDSVLSQVEVWEALGLSLPVSVNISARHLLQANFPNRLELLLNRYPTVAPSRLELEILETAALSDVKRAANTLAQCNRLGVKISLDDFGTGYSSLTYFRQLPVQILKIDRSFVGDMLNDPNDLGIVESVVWMARTFNRMVVAEGVETLEHGAMLVQLGCRLAQGYGIAHPMPVDQVVSWVAHWKKSEVWRELARYPINRNNLTLQVAARSFSVWIEKIAHYVEFPEVELQAELESHQCPFGSWHQSSGASRYGHFSDFEAIGVLHEKGHALANEMVSMVSRGYVDAAKGRLPELYALSEGMSRLFESLIANVTLSDLP